MARKQHKLILTDGTETVLPDKPSAAEVQRLIDCTCLDYVMDASDQSLLEDRRRRPSHLEEVISN